jgi:phospholipid transport system substrate-binding protein
VALLSRRLALCVVVACGACAKDALAQETPVQNVSAIQAPIAALDAALIDIMKRGKAAPFPQRAAILAPVLRSAFDLPTILRVSVGPSWAELPQAQQAMLLNAFESFTIVTYTANFANYSGERFDMLPELRSAGSDQIVQTRLVPASGAPIPLDYVMRQEGGVWKAIDVLLDGSISRVAVQRSDFRSLLRPGDASALTESLQRKVKDLSAGTM